MTPVLVSSRKPFDGIRKVVIFNWPLYLASISLLLVLLLLGLILEGLIGNICLLLCALLFLQLFSSLLAVEWAYDRSDLYTWNWLTTVLLESPEPQHIATVNAGFDEVSQDLQKIFPTSDIQALDFYDSDKNTEPSIARARKLYPAPNAATRITATAWRVDKKFDLIFIIFSAHEIRDQQDRVEFFKQALRHLSLMESKIVLVEHLRDIANIAAFNIGALHFYSFATWEKTWTQAHLKLTKTFSISPFVRVMVLSSSSPRVRVD